MKKIKFLILFYLIAYSCFVICLSSINERISKQEKLVARLERNLIEINRRLQTEPVTNKDNLLSQKGEKEIQLEFAEKLLLDLKGIQAKNQLAQANFKKA